MSGLVTNKVYADGKRGVTRDLAWNTSKSGHGPWRLSMSPALSFALPTGYFVELGLPLLHQDS